MLTAELALQLAQAAAVVLGHDRNTNGTRPRAVVARDPRASGEFLAAAVEAGLSSSGIDVYDAGVLPTPAAAYLVADLDADFGVMISASHNPAPDNGIKFFARGGQKLPDDVEDAIEEQLGKEPFRPVGGEVGRIQRFSDAEDRYIVHLLGTLPHRLDGLKVVLDCAHGAASGCSPQVFKDAGADVVVIGAEPDGLNINEGVGSTHLGPLKRAVLEHGADLGIAHDGDADRCLAVDHEGNEVDGDEIMAILAVALKAAGKLKDNVLVATVMSNLGLKIALREAGISLRETGVGDRYVLEGMREGGFNLGGEQSGHVIFADHATTGDGVLTGLQIAAQVALTGRPLKELATVMTKLPQVLINVKGVDRTRVKGDEAVAAAVAAGRSRTRRHRTRPAASLRHGARGARDGGGRGRGDRPGRRGAAGPGGPHRTGPGARSRIARPDASLKRCWPVTVAGAAGFHLRPRPTACPPISSAYPGVVVAKVGKSAGYRPRSLALQVGRGGFQAEVLLERRDAALGHVGGCLRADVAQVPGLVEISGDVVQHPRVADHEAEAVGVRLGPDRRGLVGELWLEAVAPLPSPISKAQPVWCSE